MRIHRLELTGVGPFRERQVIDFDPLTASGLFLIDGPTGSGKSTLIDAIVYALFGVMSGGKASDDARIRSSFCQPEDPTGVVCEFSVDGRRHRISRVPAGYRDPDDPKRRAKAAPARQVLRELAADGTEVRVLTSDAEIKDHVTALLGLGSEQFRQLVVLPQGQFAELLRMKPRERLEALGPLLGDAFFTRLQEQLKARGDEAAKQRAAADDAVDSAAQRLHGRLATYLEALAEEAREYPFADASLTDDDRQDAVTEVLTELAERAATLAASQPDQETVVATARRDAEQAASVADVIDRLGEAREGVAQAVEALDPLDSGIADAALAGRITELTLLEGSLVDHAEWEAQAPTREAARQQRQAERDRLSAEVEQRQQRLEALPQQKAEIKRRHEEASKLASTFALATSQLSILEGLQRKANELEQLRPKLKAAGTKAEKARASLAAADVAATTAREHWNALVTAQLQQRAAHLASQLQPGQPCAVCGSVEHPRPAAPADGEAETTDDMITRAQQAEAAAVAVLDKARGTATSADEAWQDLVRQASALEGALDALTPAEITTRHDQAAKALAEAEQAQESLAGIAAELADLDTAAQSLTDEIAKLGQRVSQAEGELAADARVEEQRVAKIAEAVGEGTTATTALRATRARVASLRALEDAATNLAQAAATVPADQRELAPAAARERADDLAGKLAVAEQQLKELVSTVSALTSTVNEATPLAAAFTKALAKRAAIRDATAVPMSLAAVVTGAAGSANSLRLQLRSYALQRRFESVLAAASVHLQRMSAGKFSFELNDEKAAGQSGLGIAVFDSWTGHRQDPKSLSGGETFYASLSLALGLADVVRNEAGGSALETLFVDEGFGSLDQDTLYQVLDQLDLLRAGGRAVGVVSHVTEMKEQIPDRIEVRRQPDRTSTVTTTGAP